MYLTIPSDRHIYSPGENLPSRMIYILICWFQRIEQLVMRHLTIENDNLTILRTNEDRPN